jgi:hypothetical protein
MSKTKDLFYQYRETAPLTTGQNSRLFEPTLRVDIPAAKPSETASEPTPQLKNQRSKRLFIVYEDINGEEKGIFAHAKLDECQRFAAEYLQAKPTPAQSCKFPPHPN